jgi:ABC-2 type transport system permease protein
MNRWHESFQRFLAIAFKEFIQMRRDRVTFAMMVGIPLLQLVLFGFAINSDPRHLPLAVLDADGGPAARAMVWALHTSTYFQLAPPPASEEEAEQLIAKGKVQFVLNIPPGFQRALVRGDRPQLLLQADATDPAATSNALAAFREIAARVWRDQLRGPLQPLLPAESPVELQIHARYNPEAITSRNIVPGLMGVTLTMTMVMITALAITRERERGTMESLLATPVRPIEVILGKILPYILIGYIQCILILTAGWLIFNVPFQGSVPLLLGSALFFIAANLSVGILFSTMAKNQLQGMQMAFFFFLPSMLLSGFMFPFRGMPDWAQFLGNILPLTHFLRIVRGILLKGNGLAEVLPHLLPILIFTLAVLGLGSRRYQRTLD